MIINYTGYDQNSIARVYGYGNSQDEAKKQVRLAAQAYVRQRPDTAPLDKWTFLWSMESSSI